MATALVTRLVMANKSAPNIVACIADCYFAGDDVDATIEGFVHTISVTAPNNYNLSDLKAAVVGAVQAQATDLGFTVNSNDVTLPSFENG